MPKDGTLNQACSSDRCRAKVRSNLHADGAPTELFAILGSSGFLEFSTNKGAASRAAGADKSSEVTVTIG
jgi:S-adenosylmethionine hydrolase